MSVQEEGVDVHLVPTPAPKVVGMASFHMHLLSVALCLSAGFQQGYIASVLNQPYKFIEQFINATIQERFDVEPSEYALDLLWSGLNIAFPLATIFGQFLAAWLCHRLGRRGTALFSCLLYIPGTALCSLSYICRSFELLYVGRLLWSLANGVNSVNATVWIVECAPPTVRGRMAAMQEFSMAVGSVFCSAVGIPFSTDSLWPYVFLPNIPVVVIAVSMFGFLPDSPTCIIERKGDYEQARKALALYHGVAEDSQVLDAELKECEPKKGRREDGSSLGIVFNPFLHSDDRSKVIRQAAWLGVMVKIAYVFTGARGLRAYSTFVIYELSHFTLQAALYGSFFIGLLRLPFTLIPVVLVDRVGRRPLIVISLVITILSLVTMMFSIHLGPHLKVVALIAFGSLLLINGSGLGAVSRFYAAELVPRNLLLSSVSILAGIEVFTKIVVEFSFFPLANMIGVDSFFIFLIPSVGFLLLAWAYCPETANRSVNQVLNDIAHRMNLKVNFNT